jgi:hypothetical protein
VKTYFLADAFLGTRTGRALFAAPDFNFWGDSKNMGYRNFRGSVRGLRRTAFVAAMAVAFSAHAQSTVGDISGTATYAAGESVVVTGIDSGTTRTYQVGTDGRFRATSLPGGRYDVQVVKDGQTVTRSTVSVVAGQTVALNLAATAGSSDASNLSAVTVSANATPAIDVTTAESRTTFTADKLNALPIPRDVTSVALLAPGTVKGSGNLGDGNLASFGGASVAENSYYVNGFNTTNLFKNLSFAEVPYQAIDQIDVQTGGYGAQYGFSTGGVTSVNVKRGTNEWKGGVSYVVSPGFARSNEGNIYAKNGNIWYDNSHDGDTDSVYTAWIGGPLIKDKLFMFVLGQFEKETYQSTASNSAYASSNSGIAANSSRTGNKSPYWVAKLDWNITDDHHLEWTGFDNSSSSQHRYYGTQYTDGDASLTGYKGFSRVHTGGSTNIFKYTGYLTDSLTLSAQYGVLKNDESTYYVAPDGSKTTYDGDVFAEQGGCPYIAYNSRYTGQRYNTCYVSSSTDIYKGKDQRKSWRVDLDWRVGDHDLAAGYSDERWRSSNGSSYSGGHEYLYYPNNRVYDIQFSTGGDIAIRQKSAYAEDHWQATDNLMVYVGVRYDGFENKNGSGQTFVKQDNIWQPRLGFTYDVLGDASWKIFGTAGRYSLPIAANVALRAASASFYTQDLYSYTGVNTATGAPILGPQLSHFVINGEDGSTPNPASVADRDLKPYTQDEFILGFEHQVHSDVDFLDNWVVGVKGTYRKLRNAIDDTCDWRPFYNRGVAAGLDMSNQDQWTVPDGVPGCFIYNPGSALSLNVDLAGDGVARSVTVPGVETGPKAKRSYQGLDFTASKNTDKYYLNFTYTLSRNFGNTEGLVRSDIGQEDTGTTEDFDFPEIMRGANGYLQNDRRHNLKIYGAWKFTPEWSVGLNLAVQSGAPISCLGGGLGTFGTEYGYGGGFHYCNGEISKEGSSGRTPWVWTVSPNVIFKPQWAPGLAVTLSALNLFNNQKDTQVYQTGESISTSGIYTGYYDTIYKVGTYKNSPRSFRLQAQYDFSL